MILIMQLNMNEILIPYISIIGELIDVSSLLSSTPSSKDTLFDFGDEGWSAETFI